MLGLLTGVDDVHVLEPHRYRVDTEEVLSIEDVERRHAEILEAGAVGAADGGNALPELRGIELDAEILGEPDDLAVGDFVDRLEHVTRHVDQLLIADEHTGGAV